MNYRNRKIQKKTPVRKIFLELGAITVVSLFPVCLEWTKGQSKNNFITENRGRAAYRSSCNVKNKNVC